MTSKRDWQEAVTDKAGRRQIDDRTLPLQLAGTAERGAARHRRCHAVLQAFARTQGMPAVHVVDRPDGPIRLRFWRTGSGGTVQRPLEVRSRSR